MPVVSTAELAKSKWGVPCIICNETVPLSEMESLQLEHGLYRGSKVCDKCKAAVMKIREEMGEEKYD